MIGDMAELMQQAKKMKKEMKRMKKEIAKLQVVGESESGLAKITMSGKNRVKGVELDPAIISDKKLLEKHITEAVNNASLKIQQITDSKMAEVGAGLNLPQSSDMPF
ncbi:MAG: YbaB/EbfC family nucleoid-associated protein [Pseudomonadota bacterium]